MSDAIRLPHRPDLDHYKKLAKELRRACRAGGDEAIRAWAAAWLQRLEQTEPGDLERVERQWQLLVARRPALARCTLTDAQFFIARVHEFATWATFAAHIEAISRETSGTGLFESAVDAIVAGDAAAVQRLLRDHPDLVRARSTREHHATLLHYVSANGVEDFRQKTPPNIVDITRLLLDAGADVNATSNSYGPHDTTFLLTATSCHPEDAGVQIPLLELLLERGAAIDWPPDSSTVNACLHNGRGLAADFCASRGARLDLEGAAGVGRVDVMQSFVHDDGTLTGGATRKQMIDGIAWAAQFGKTDAVAFLLDRGIDVKAKLAHHGNSALHWAAYGGYPDTIRMLLARGAAIHDKDDTYNGTPLEWAIYAWGNRTLDAEAGERFYEVVEMLARAGARLDPHWLANDDPDRGRASKRLQNDPRMIAALGTRPSNKSRV